MPATNQFARLVAVMAAATALLSIFSQAHAQTPSDGVIYACGQGNLNKSDGLEIKIVAANVACNKEAVRLSWSVIGPAGLPGAPGAAGPQGPAGPAGANGAPGAAGAQGPVGPMGLPGPGGATGPAGPAGATGPAGLAGVQGATGAQGPVGPVGPAGAAGAAGPQGPAGPAGATGPAGPTGAQGPAGPQGIAGPTGAQGLPGATGPAGPAGPAGASAPSGGVQGVLVCSNVPTVTSPLAGLTVYLPGRSYTVITGADGSFQMDNVVAGSYNLIVARGTTTLAGPLPLTVADTMVTASAAIAVACQ